MALNIKRQKYSHTDQIIENEQKIFNNNLQLNFQKAS